MIPSSGYQNSVPFKTIQLLFLIVLSISILLFFATLLLPFAIALVSNRSQINLLMVLSVMTGLIIRIFGAIGGDNSNQTLLAIFTISMTSMNLLTIFEPEATLSPRTDIYDFFHLTANIMVSILGLLFILNIRRIQKLQSLCGPKPIIVIDKCDDEEVDMSLGGVHSDSVTHSI